MNLDPGGSPTCREHLSVVEDKVRTRMVVLVEVLDDAQVDLDVVCNRKSVAADAVLTRGEPKLRVVGERHVEFAHRKDWRDPLEEAHDLAELTDDVLVGVG
jgi:hypothetical protein